MLILVITRKKSKITVSTIDLYLLLHTGSNDPSCLRSAAGLLSPQLVAGMYTFFGGR
jgi:hypothetical protein